MKKYLALALLIFAAPTIASTKFPAGDWVSMDGDDELSISADGEYEVRYQWDDEPHPRTSRGQALLDHTCNTGTGREGNLWVVTDWGKGVCYKSSVTGGKLVIQEWDSTKLGGIWIKANSR